MSAAPIAFFCYRRPEHTRSTLASLAANPEARETILYAFCDGPRDPADAELQSAVAATRAAVREFADSFQSVELVERERNCGLAENIIGGVSQVIDAHGRVIVVEDDLYCSPGFLKYLNDGLDMYANTERVASIHAYVVPLAGTPYAYPETFFLRGADCWGWATWDRAWSGFRADGAALLSELRERRLSRRFDLDGTYEYTAMLAEQVAGRNDSWAIRWHASAFLADRLTLYPGQSLVQNTGLDGSGTHCGVDDLPNWSAASAGVELKAIPIQEHRRARAELAAHYRRLRGRAGIAGFLSRVKAAVKNRLAPALPNPGSK